MFRKRRMSENEGFFMSNLALNDRRSDRGSISSVSSLKSMMTPLIKIKGKNRVRHGQTCEIQHKITESVEKNLCHRVRLGQACRDGKKEVVARLLQGSIHSINSIDEDGMAPIHYAARCNNVDILRMLIRAGADIEVKGSEQILTVTPLLCSAKFNAIEACSILIREGVDVNVKNCYGQTALHHAVRRQNSKIVELLLTEGKMDVNVVDIDNTTALHMAAQVGDALSAKLLLHHGVDILAQDNDGFTAFHIAAREGKGEVLETLLNTARERKMDTTKILDMPDNYGNTSLHLSVKNGRCCPTRICLDFGASSCVWESSLQTPLHHAALSGNVCVMTELFKGKDLDIHTEDGDGMTPILRASLAGHHEAVEYLLEQGAHLNAPPDTGSPSPLLCAVKRDHHKTIKFLLTKGAIIDQLDAQWRNCLHIAAACSDPKTLKILLEHNAKHLVDKRDAYGKTPLHYAAFRCKNVCKIVKLLTEAGGQPTACDNEEQIPLHYSSRSGNTVCSRTLLELSPDSVNHPDARSLTPLHLAAASGNRDVCRLLLDNNADVDYRDDFRLTPLFHAVLHGCPLTIKVMVEYGADLNALDKSRKTPLLEAAFHGKIAAFKTLLECGADITAVCQYGYNVLDAALENDHILICEEIIRNQRWRDVLANVKFNKVSPMKRLIEKFPCVAKIAMDKCITETTYIDTDQNYAIEYDFQYLSPKPGEDVDSNGKRYFGPQVMLEVEREDLLRHPLTKTLMATKWKSVGVKFFYGGFLIYACFVACFSHYMYCMHKLEHYNKSTSSGDEPFFLSHCAKKPIIVSEFVLVLFSAINLAYELYQFYTEGPKYFELTNMLQLSTFICAIITVSPIDREGKMSDASWEAGVVGVMLSYLTALQYIQCLFYAGIYVTMLFEVLKSLLKVLALFSLLIVGFGLVFMFVLDKSRPFDNFGTSLFKMGAMTMGEIEYSRYFVDEEPERFTLALFVFLVFSLMMPVALMNLLIGLAVGDIDSVQSHAELKMMTTEIEAVSEFEEKMPMFLRNRLHKSKLVVYPNKPHKLRILKRCLGRFGIREIMALRMKDDPTNKENSNTNDHLTSLESKVEVQAERIAVILNELQAQRSLLEGIAASSNANSQQHHHHHQNEPLQQQPHNILEAENILGRL